MSLAHAITIHKSQGLTLDKIVVDIGAQERAIGLSYVALSRVRTVDDLAIFNPYTLERSTAINDSRQMSQRRNFLL